MSGDPRGGLAANRLSGVDGGRTLNLPSNNRIGLLKRRCRANGKSIKDTTFRP